MKRGILSSALILLPYFMLLGQTTTSTYYFAHSLIWHQKLPDNQANIPFWLAELESAAGDVCLTSGKHTPGQNGATALPPDHSWAFTFSNHGSAMTPGGAYVSDAHQNVVLTYMNWEIIYDSGSSIGQRIPGTIPKATDSIASIFNWLNANDPGVNLYLYECWPKIEKNYILNGQDWNAVTNTGNPPNASQWALYLNYALGNSNGFWKDLQDSLINKSGITNTKLIPSSMICAKLWQPGGILSDMAPASIFEDIGPHGLPSAYFLAAMVVYAAQHQQAPTKPFNSHSQIDQRILDRFSDISAFIMTELSAFNFPNGESRVWENTTTIVEESKELGETNIKIYPNPVKGIINLNIGIKLFGNVYTIYDNTGRVVLTGIINQENTTIELGNLSDGIYMFSVGENMKQTFKVIKE